MLNLLRKNDIVLTLNKIHSFSSIDVIKKKKKNLRTNSKSERGRREGNF